MSAQKRPADPASGLEQPVVWLQPGDLSTDTGQTPLRAWIDNGDRPVAPGLLEDVAGALELWKMEGMKGLAARTSVHHVAEAPAHPPTGQSHPRSFVELEPTEPIAQGWHALVLRRLPHGVAPASHPASKLFDGAYSVRFATDSRPTPARIFFCTKRGDEIHVTAELSQNVRNGGAATFPLAIRRGARACRFVGGEATPWLHFACDAGTVGADEPWRVELGAGLVSLDGRPVQTFDGEPERAYLLDAKALEQVSPDCSVHRF